MMKTYLTVLAAAGLALAGAAQANEKLAQASGCNACHTLEKKVIGPAYKDVAAKYRSDKGAEAKLADHVKKGSTGVWGPVPMPPNATVPDADVRALVKWILSRK